MKRIIITLLSILLVAYLVICGFLYFAQERLIFLPTKLPANFAFKFPGEYEELSINSNGAKLSGLLFKAPESKGLVFYCHGNAGSLKTWGAVAQTYTSLGYDLFIFDYRSYGKSEGDISNQGQLYADNELWYETMTKRYDEKKIVVLGYSLGTGFASKLAADHNPRHLILQAPYFSIKDMTKRNYPFAPTFLLKYRFNNNANIAQCSMPITIFHGTRDRVLYFGSSEKLKAAHGSKINFIPLEGEGHNGITGNPVYLKSLKGILH